MSPRKCFSVPNYIDDCAAQLQKQAGLRLGDVPGIDEFCAFALVEFDDLGAG